MQLRVLTSTLLVQMEAAKGLGQAAGDLQAHLRQLLEEGEAACTSMLQVCTLALLAAPLFLTSAHGCKQTYPKDDMDSWPLGLSCTLRLRSTSACALLVLWYFPNLMVARSTSRCARPTWEAGMLQSHAQLRQIEQANDRIGAYGTEGDSPGNDTAAADLDEPQGLRPLSRLARACGGIVRV